jgi:hypothetical protein
LISFSLELLAIRKGPIPFAAVLGGHFEFRKVPVFLICHFKNKKKMVSLEKMVESTAIGSSLGNFGTFLDLPDLGI